MTALSKFAPHVLAISLAAAFPAAQAASSVAAEGSLTDDGIGGSIDVQPKNMSFSQAATAGAFSQSIVSEDHPDFPWDNKIAVSTASTGDGQFGSSIRIERLYGSASTIESAVMTSFASSLTNSSLATQTAAFQLKIDALSFGVEWGDTSHGIGAQNRASFSAMVYLNGSVVPVWSTHFDLTAAYSNDASGFTSVTESGASLGLTNALTAACFGSVSDCGANFGVTSFGISGYTQTLNFDIAAGQTLDLRYVVSLTSETNVYGGATSVFFADPTTGLGGSAELSFATPVPEPESAALLAAGLGLVAAAKRRALRRQAATA